MPINASPQFEKAQVEYEKAQTTEERIYLLKKMITLAPKHKGSENLLKQLRTRLKRLKEKKERESKKTGSTKKGIKKEDMQAVIVGKTNSGKSTLLKKLTNTKPEIENYEFTTKEPIIGMIDFRGTKIQLIEIPAIESEYYNRSLVNTADTLLILVNKIEQINGIEKNLEKTKGKRIIIFNDKNNLDENSLRKISATLQSRKYNFVLINIKNQKEIEELKEKIFQSFNKIRIYTKEPNKEKSPKPIILNPEATIENVAEKILKSFSKDIKSIRIWGPSSKFPGQKVGLKHKLRDLDVVEFKTK